MAEESGGVGEPALLHGQGKVGHSVNVTAHIDFVTNSSLKRENFLQIYITFSEISLLSSQILSREVLPASHLSPREAEP